VEEVVVVEGVKVEEVVDDSLSIDDLFFHTRYIPNPILATMNINNNISEIPSLIIII